MSEEEEIKQSQFAEWLNRQLYQCGWTQGKLIAQSGNTKKERLSSAAVSRYSTGKMLPDSASCQKIARAFGVPVELVLRKAGFINTPLPDEADWLQRAIDDLAYAVESGQLSEEGRLALATHIHRERLLRELEREKGKQHGQRKKTEQYSSSGAPVTGWSQRRVAELVGTSEDEVSRWERGERKPGPFFQEKLCLLYGKNAAELGFIQLHLPPHSKPLIKEITDINQTINEQLDHAESIINLAWEAWFGSRPKQVTREITKLLPLLEKMLALPLAALHALRAKELIIRCHGLLGTICLDALQNDSALYHYIQAHRFAEDVRDVNLTSTYLALIGDVLRQQNDKATAISYMENAREQAGQAHPATLGHILQLLAYTYGDIGNGNAFEQAISEATDLLAFTGGGRDTVRSEFVPFEIYEIRGKVNRDLGRPLDALPYLELAEKSLWKAESITPRWQALLDISRGQACCDAGDITTGIDMISKGFILARQCHSPHQMNRVRKWLRKQQKGPFRNHPRVLELKDLLYETYVEIEVV